MRVSTLDLWTMLQPLTQQTTYAHLKVSFIFLVTVVTVTTNSSTIFSISLLRSSTQILRASSKSACITLSL